MYFIVSFYAACLFFILTPNVILRIPPKGNDIVVAVVHTCIFALIYNFTNKFVWTFSLGWINSLKKEGFREGYKFGQYLCGPPAYPCPDGKFCINRTCTDNPDF